MKFMEFCFCRLVGEIWILDEMDGVVGSTPAVTGLGFCHQEYVEMVRLGDLKEQSSESRSVQCSLKLECLLIITSSFKWMRTECDYTWTPGRGQEDILPLLSFLTNNPMQRTNWRFADSIQTTIRTAWKHTWSAVGHLCQTMPDQSIESKKTRITMRSHPILVSNFIFVGPYYQHYCKSLHVSPFSVLLVSGRSSLQCVIERTCSKVFNHELHSYAHVSSGNFNTPAPSPPKNLSKSRF